MTTTNYQQARRVQYQYHTENYSFLNDWRKNPYSFIKSRIYMELSAILVTLLLKTRISPNTVTLGYIAAGIIGGVLIAIPTEQTILAGVVIFFFKGVLDWSDGHLARATGRTSQTGKILDVFGGAVNDICFQTALGFYVALYVGYSEFLYIVPLIPLFYTLNLIPFSQQVLFEELGFSNQEGAGTHSTPEDHPRLVSRNEINEKSLGTVNYIYRLLSTLLDARARGVDFVCLIIIIELFTNLSIAWLIVLFFIARNGIFFIGSIYLVFKQDWIEKTWVAAQNNVRPKNGQ